MIHCAMAKKTAGHVSLSQRRAYLIATKDELTEQIARDAKRLKECPTIKDKVQRRAALVQLEMRAQHGKNNLAVIGSMIASHNRECDEVGKPGLKI